jgi:hypothetical protein
VTRSRDSPLKLKDLRSVMGAASGRPLSRSVPSVHLSGIAAGYYRQPDASAYGSLYANENGSAVRKSVGRRKHIKLSAYRALIASITTKGDRFATSLLLATHHMIQELVKGTSTAHCGAWSGHEPSTYPSYEKLPLPRSCCVDKAKRDTKIPVC